MRRSKRTRAAVEGKPRLLVLASTYPRWQADHEPGFVHELSRRLGDDFDVVVLCPHAPGARKEEKMDGVNVVRYRYAPERFESLVYAGGIVANLKASPWKLLLLPSFIFGQFYAIYKLVRRWRPNVIHAHWLIPQGLLVAMLGCLDRRIPPFIVTSHGADLFALKSRFFLSLKRFVIKRAAGLTVVSMAMRKEIERLGVESSNVQVQPMGVDLSNAFRFDGNSPRSSNEILFVGRLVEKKGAKYLLQAMPLVLDHCPDAHLTIAGFGPEEHNLKELMKELGLVGKVDFRGAVPQKELPSFYRRAALFAAPFIQAEGGDQEGLGLVLVEALGCGCPAVVSDVPATRDVTEGIENLITVPQKDVNELARAIVDILQHHVEYAARAGSSVQKLNERFDWSFRAQSYSRILKASMSDTGQLVSQ